MSLVEAGIARLQILFSRYTEFDELSNMCRPAYGLLALASLLRAERALEFNRDVRSILSDKCYLCHGPDAVAKKIPLRLDSEAAAKADLGRGRRAIVDGDPSASQMIRRTAATDPTMRKPPGWA